MCIWCTQLSILCKCESLGRFAVASPSVKADVEVAEGLHVSLFGFEGIIAGEDLVKVNIVVEEYVIPLQVWEDQIPWDSKNRFSII